ncbi:hypothetical protein DPEC_G00292340 [Dallia pectoralis]|uniref:Uncharacterized protein n=1 Tax=Dallia pectoralis TaxID=75939 RepID=A0ACC2FIA1_DALPE|nr:hypothetical protein DPEC_G00292340 [Dallia pectoralis]
MVPNARPCSADHILLVPLLPSPPAKTSRLWASKMETPISRAYTAEIPRFSAACERFMSQTNDPQLTLTFTTPCLMNRRKQALLATSVWHCTGGVGGIQCYPTCS